MYTKEREGIALRECERLGSVYAVMLGYPSKSTLYRWYERKKAGVENKHGCITGQAVSREDFCNTPEHPRYTPSELKYETICRCFEMGEDVEYVSREIGYSRPSIYALEALYTQLKELQLEVDVLKETIEVLKKTQAPI